MSYSITKFKNKIFGGFNRDDVVNYIEKLADERNRLQVENSKLRERIALMEAEAENNALAARTAIENAEALLESARREKAAVVSETSKTLDGLLEKFDSVKAALTASAENLESGIAAINTAVSTISDSIDSAETHFSEMRHTIGPDTKEGA